MSSLNAPEGEIKRGKFISLFITTNLIHNHLFHSIADKKPQIFTVLVSKVISQLQQLGKAVNSKATSSPNT